MHTEETGSTKVLFSKILGSIQDAVAFSLLSTRRILFDTYYLAILRAHLKAIKKAKLVVNARETLVIFVVYRNLSISGPSALFS